MRFRYRLGTWPFISCTKQNSCLYDLQPRSMTVPPEQDKGVREGMNAVEVKETLMMEENASWHSVCSAVSSAKVRLNKRRGGSTCKLQLETGRGRFHSFCWRFSSSRSTYRVGPQDSTPEMERNQATVKQPA